MRKFFYQETKIWKWDIDNNTDPAYEAQKEEETMKQREKENAKFNKVHMMS